MFDQCPAFCAQQWVTKGICENTFISANGILGEGALPCLMGTPLLGGRAPAKREDARNLQSGSISGAQPQTKSNQQTLIRRKHFALKNKNNNKHPNHGKLNPYIWQVGERLDWFRTRCTMPSACFAARLGLFMLTFLVLKFWGAHGRNLLR